MANEHRGEVSFETPDGKSYVVKLSTYRVLQLQKDDDKRTGIDGTLHQFHVALTSVKSQEQLTEEEACEILEDMGLDAVYGLINQTKWGVLVKKANDSAEAKAKELKAAAQVEALVLAERTAEKYKAAGGKVPPDVSKFIEDLRALVPTGPPQAGSTGALVP